jgi:hypothetical protein
MSSLSVDNSNLRQRRDRRIERPERLVLNGQVLVRNDVKAQELGITVRAINRGDRRFGAPFVYVAGVKYRPERDFDAHLLSQIQSRKPASPRRRRASP